LKKHAASAITRRKEKLNAFSEYIAHRKWLEILSSFGTIDFDPNYNYKTALPKEA